MAKAENSSALEVLEPEVMAGTDAAGLPARPEELTRQQIELLKNTICQGATDHEFQLFLHTAQRLQLDPFAKQIYFNRRRTKQPDGSWKVVGRGEPTVDGLRSSAERTGLYEGQTKVEWCGTDGKWVDVWLGDGPPAAARVGVHRKGFCEPMVSVARYKSYVQTTKHDEPTNMWQKMADNQLAKCAESLALRKAFPLRFAGIYTVEEMGQEESEGREPERQSRGQGAPPVEDDDDLMVALRECETDEDVVALWPAVCQRKGARRKRLEEVFVTCRRECVARAKAANEPPPPAEEPPPPEPEK